MAIVTPLFKGHENLSDLASRFVEVDDIPWKPTPCEGIEMKVLMEDEETGMMTALFFHQLHLMDVKAWAPGLFAATFSAASSDSARSTSTSASFVSRPLQSSNAPVRRPTKRRVVGVAERFTASPRFAGSPGRTRRSP